MNGIIAANKIDINISDNSTSIVLSEDALFNEVAFKVLQNQEKHGLIKCGKLSQNGRIKLVYDSSKYKSLDVVAHQLSPKEFLTVVSNVHDIIKCVSENGFIKCENILVSSSTIFIDMTNLSVHMICVPLSLCSLYENKELAKRDLEQVIYNEKKKIPGVGIEAVRKFLNEGNYSLPAHDKGMMREPIVAPEPPRRNEPLTPERTSVEVPEPPRKREDSGTNVKTLVAIIVEVASILMGAAILLAINALVGMLVIIIGCLVGMILYFVLPSGKRKEEPVKGLPIVLASTNVSPQITFVINKPVYSIGRQSASVDGVIENHKTVGRIHCKIFNDGRACYIQDMNSMNGTFVNNKRLEGNKRELINKGDLVKIAKVEFVVK